MEKLSNKVRERLNDPKIIREMAEKILVKAGKENHAFRFDRGYYYDVRYNFSDFPNKKISLKGRVNLYYDEEMKKFLHKFGVSQKDKQNIDIISEYHNKFKMDEKGFSFIGIFWSENPLMVDFTKLREYSGREIFDGRNLKRMFDYSSDKVSKFEKGPWQEYLAKVYASVLGSDNFVNFQEGKGDFLI